MTDGEAQEGLVRFINLGVGCVMVNLQEASAQATQMLLVLFNIEVIDAYPTGFIAPHMLAYMSTGCKNSPLFQEFRLLFTTVSQ